MRNLNKPPRYNVASIQAQQTLGGDVIQSADEGQYVEWRDYKWLLDSYAFVRDQWKDLNSEVERLKEGNECLNAFHDKEMERSAYLCEQVERLRKLGTEMGKHLPDTDEANRAYIDFEAGGKQTE